MSHSRCRGGSPDRGQTAELAGVTVRILLHHDEIGLLRPSTRTVAGRRAYSADEVERLREIADLVNDPTTDAVAHLRRLRGLLLDGSPSGSGTRWERPVRC